MINNSVVSEFMLFVLLVIPALFQTLVILFGLIFAITRIRIFPKPARWLIAGLSLFLVGRGLGWLGSAYLARMVTPGELAYYHSILSFITNMTCSTGLVAMIYAVFVSRSEPDSRTPTWDEGSSMDAANLRNRDSNPYSTPASS